MMEETNESSSELTSPSQPAWIVGWVDTPVGRIPQVANKLSFSDYLGSWKVRWAAGRMKYWVEPGLYALGSPDKDSVVLVTANYKLSFDSLRDRLATLDAWIMVLNTYGINVWCAAGKGTFGTKELIRQLEVTRIADIVSHRKLILPQLGAPGVAAHQVIKKTGFRVVYGPVRAVDLPRFLDSGLEATRQMRQVTFPFKDRIVLAPVELVMALKHAGYVFLILLGLAGIGQDIFSISRMVSHTPYVLALIVSSLLLGAVVTPALLPWIPGRPFSLKGALVGLAGSVVLHYWFGVPLLSAQAIGGIFLLVTFSSFLGMNFTGASTYTSLSGVRKEMGFAVPAQILILITGLGFLIKGFWI